MSFLNILPAPKSFPFIVPYLLFENTMPVTEFNAMIFGLFQLGSAYEWVVTKKSGHSLEGDLVSLIEKEQKHLQKTGSLQQEVSFQLKGIHFYFLLFQGISFLLVGLDLIGEQVD
ncbi:unnamed protein product [Vicia faba]|uniref:Uncharacterized protein n=1 Tax=Vicia faba TaxID=3906 RepID=A0AAV1AD13_VICFA|nr:unnamed protein product [Vicia faba]